MSLMQLLSVSPTFTEAKNKADDYKVQSAGYLPKFAPSKRPLCLAPAHPAAKSAVQATLFVDSKPVPTPAPAQAPAPVCPVSAAVQSKAASAVAAKMHEKASSTQPRPARPTWRSMLKEFFFGRRKRSQNGTAVQTELALERVRVMRNDLTDADLEVVSTREKRQMAGLAWSRLTARFFNPNEFAAKTERQVPAAPAAAPAQNQSQELVKM